MVEGPILIIGAGIGGLTSAIALRRKRFDVQIIEKDQSWSVYGVGIIQQSNVVRAMAELGVLEDYLTAGFGFDQLEIFIPSGLKVATIPAPKLTPEYPANVGIARRALHKVLGERAMAAGAGIRLGVTARTIEDDGQWVTVGFSDGATGKYALVIGADGLYSETRRAIFPEAPAPEFTGQSVWRYNFERPQNLTIPRAITPSAISSRRASSRLNTLPNSSESMNRRGNRKFIRHTRRSWISGAAASAAPKPCRMRSRTRVCSRLPKFKAVALFQILGGHTV
jgi:2-polyprenyl-6-methoxyphenol hydroxylase-like FAD-dependent oxidoreductase